MEFIFKFVILFLISTIISVLTIYIFKNKINIYSLLGACFVSIIISIILNRTILFNNFDPNIKIEVLPNFIQDVLGVNNFQKEANQFVSQVIFLKLINVGTFLFNIIFYTLGIIRLNSINKNKNERDIIKDIVLFQVIGGIGLSIIACLIVL